MNHDRMRLGSALLGITAIAAIGLIPVTPAQADPDIKDVQAKVDRLYHEAEQASERYNDAELDLADLRKDLAALRADEQRQSDKLEAVRDEVADSILRGYQGESISTVGQVVVSDDPSAFLGQLSTMSGFNDLQDDMFAAYSTELEALDLRTRGHGRPRRRDRGHHRRARRREEDDRQQARRRQGPPRPTSRPRSVSVCSPPASGTTRMPSVGPRLRSGRRRRLLRDGPGR